MKGVRRRKRAERISIHLGWVQHQSLGWTAAVAETRQHSMINSVARILLKALKLEIPTKIRHFAIAAELKQSRVCDPETTLETRLVAVNNYLQVRELVREPVSDNFASARLRHAERRAPMAERLGTRLIVTDMPVESRGPKATAPNRQPRA